MTEFAMGGGGGRREGRVGKGGREAGREEETLSTKEGTDDRGKTEDYRMSEVLT